MARIRMSLVTPSAQLIDREVDEVQVPGEAGGFGVRQGHAPLISSLGAGPLVLTEGGTPERFAIMGGFVEVSPDAVVVLAAEAIPEADIDRDAAAADVETALAELAGQPMDSVAYQDAARKLERARALVAL